MSTMALARSKPSNGTKTKGKFNPKDLFKKGRCFIFTWNNYTPESLKKVEEFHINENGTIDKQLVWLHSAFEIGKNQTRHLQGAIAFKSGSYRTLRSIVKRLTVSKPVYAHDPDTKELIKDADGNKITLTPGNNADVQLGYPDYLGGSDYGRLRYNRKGTMDSELYHDMIKKKLNPEDHLTFGVGFELHHVYGEENLPLTPTLDKDGNIKSRKGQRTDMEDAKQLVMYLFYLRTPPEYHPICPKAYEDKVLPYIENVNPIDLDINRILFDLLPQHLQSGANQKWLEKAQEIYRADTVALTDPVEIHAEVKEWYTHLSAILEEIPKRSDRRIHIVVDHVGNAAKSTFCRQLEAKFPQRTIVMSPGKDADLACCLKKLLSSKTGATVLCYDMPRSKSDGEKDYCSFFFLESVKNGKVFSPKYDSNQLPLQPMHVVVFRNSLPTFNQLSLDRFRVYEFVRPDDPEYKLDQHGHQMYVVRDHEWVCEQHALQLEQHQGTTDKKNPYQELLCKVTENITQLTCLASKSKQQDANLLNYHTGPPNKENTPFHVTAVAKARKRHAKEYTNGQVLKGTTLKLRGVQITPAKLKEYDSSDVLSKRAAKKRRLTARTEINPEFLNAGVTEQPRHIQDPSENMAGNTVGIESHQILKTLCQPDALP
jgi:hypothetical protein